MTKQDLVQAVRDHAEANYEKGGWDILVECYTDEEIVEVIGKARTAAGAIKKAGEAVGVYDGKRRDIEATAF